MAGTAMIPAKNAVLCEFPFSGTPMRTPRIFIELHKFNQVLAKDGLFAAPLSPRHAERLDDVRHSHRTAPDGFYDRLETYHDPIVSGVLVLSPTASLKELVEKHNDGDRAIYIIDSNCSLKVELPAQTFKTFDTASLISSNARKRVMFFINYAGDVRSVREPAYIVDEPAENKFVVTVKKANDVKVTKRFTHKDSDLAVNSMGTPVIMDEIDKIHGKRENFSFNISDEAFAGWATFWNGGICFDRSFAGEASRVLLDISEIKSKQPSASAKSAILPK